MARNFEARIHSPLTSASLNPNRKPEAASLCASLTLEQLGNRKQPPKKYPGAGLPNQLAKARVFLALLTFV